MKVQSLAPSLLATFSLLHCTFATPLDLRIIKAHLIIMPSLYLQHALCIRQYLGHGSRPRSFNCSSYTHEHTPHVAEQRAFSCRPCSPTSDQCEAPRYGPPTFETASLWYIDRRMSIWCINFNRSYRPTSSPTCTKVHDSTDHVCPASLLIVALLTFNARISCNIQFSSLDGTNIIATETSDGIYGVQADTASMSLVVTFSYSPGSPATQLDLNVPANTAYPYFGAVGSGDEDGVTLGPGRTE